MNMKFIRKLLPKSTREKDIEGMKRLYKLGHHLVFGVMAIKDFDFSQYWHMTTKCGCALSEYCFQEFNWMFIKTTKKSTVHYIPLPFWAGVRLTIKRFFGKDMDGRNIIFWVVGKHFRISTGEAAYLFSPITGSYAIKRLAKEINDPRFKDLSHRATRYDVGRRIIAYVEWRRKELDPDNKVVFDTYKYGLDRLNNKP